MSLLDLPWSDFRRAIAFNPDAHHLIRAWHEAPGRLAAWMNFCSPNPRATYAWPEGTPRRTILGVFTALDQPRPRPAVRHLIEAGRSFGKTEMTRAAALRAILAGRTRGVLAVAERGPDATSFTSPIMELLPEWRKSERPDDDVVRRYHATAFGSVYPNARWMGGATELHISLDGDGRTDAVLWTRGIEGNLKGFNEQGIRPDLVVCDDVQTSRTAYSPTVTTSTLAAILGDCAGCGSPERPADIIVLANAIAPGDVPERLSEMGWATTRGAVWTPGMPPEGPEKRALFAILRAHDKPPEIRLREGWAYFLAHRDRILQGCSPTDPTRFLNGSSDLAVAPFNLLCLEAEVGTRLFASHHQNLRLSTDAAIWPMGAATWATLEAGGLRIGKTLYPLAGCSGAVWLDPRYSGDKQRNDYAAAAGVISIPTVGGRISVVVALETERADAAGERLLYWRCVDALAALGVTNILGGYEECGGQAKYIDPFFAEEARLRAAQGRPAIVPTPHPSTAGKYSLDRLGRLAAPIEAGRVVFLDTLRNTEGMNQARRLGSGYHDDAPDAIERAEYYLTRSPDPATFAQAMFGADKGCARR